MKKTLIVLFTFIFCFTFSVSDVSAAETLDQLLAKAKANREAYNKAKSEKELKGEEREQAIAQQKQIEEEIKTINVDIEKAKEEVEELQKEIDIKDKEIKNLMNFYQISGGESAYLEYAFGAKSFTDFIYRVAVSEQLSGANEKLINEYNQNIKDLEQKQKDLANKQNELAKKQQELAELEAKLTKEIESLQEGMLTKDREYKTTIDLVNSMKSLGCKGSDTFARCLERTRPKSSSSVSLSGASIASTNGTYMPIAKGRVTSDYGGSRAHTGIDFSNGVYKDNVYPIAAGLVILVQDPGTYTSGGKNCGNYIVYVQHNINGHPYITSYWHLASPAVSKGTTVTPNTVIGYMGGYNSIDACSFGVHVHLNLFNGNTWDIKSPNKGRINPRTIMPQIPAKGVYFTR